MVLLLSKIKKIFQKHEKKNNYLMAAKNGVRSFQREIVLGLEGWMQALIHNEQDKKYWW